MANFDQKAIIDTPKYSKMNMTYESIGTIQMGVGVPVLHKTVVPGDDWNISIDQIMRLAPLASPVFDEVSLHFRAFFVPNRILDPRWKEFITGGIGLYGASDESISPLAFTVRSAVSSFDHSRIGRIINDNIEMYDAYSSAGVGGLLDWLNFHFAVYNPADGRPATVAFGTAPTYTPTYTNLLYSTAAQGAFDILPVLGYQKIYDDWYRNERYQPEILPEIISALSEGTDTRLYDVDHTLDTIDDSTGRYSVVSPFRLWRVNYGKDRFTTALPEPVVGGDVYYGVGDTSSTRSYLQMTKNSLDGMEKGDLTVYRDPVSGDLMGHTIDGVTGYLSNSDGSVQNKEGTFANIGMYAAPTNGANRFFVEVAAAARDTIANLKMQFKMYSFFMKDTYNGNRYVEFMDSHFDVRVPDATLDRAIYLGDHKVRVSFGEVFQTSGGNPEDGTGVLGDYAGRGAAYSENGFLVNEKFLEHGQLYVIASVVPRAKYFQGIDRKFIKKDRFSYFFPEFQNIGDDVLYSKELFFSGVADSDDVLGYAPRWSELKESLDEVHGDFLTNMDHYHFGRRFSDAPVLGSVFSEVPTINDPFSVTDEFSENYLLNMRWSATAARPILMYETF